MIRYLQFLAVSSICMMLFVPFLLTSIKDKNKQGIKKLLSCAILSLVLCLVVFAIDRHDYSSKEWRYFTNYNRASTSLMDEGFPNYDENIDTYNRLSIDKDDLEMYSTWNYDDPINYSDEVINSLIEARGNRQIKIDTFVNFFYGFVSYYFNHARMIPFSYLLIASLILFVVFVKDRNNIIAVSLALVAMMCCIFYTTFIRVDNQFVFRVHSSFVLTSIFVVLCFIEFPDLKMNRIQIVTCTLLVILTMSFTRFNDWRINNLYTVSDYRKNILEDVFLDKKHLYVITEGNWVTFIEKQFEKETYLSGTNIISLGGWMTNNPLILNLKQKCNVSNLYKELVDSEVMYVLSDGGDDINKICDYIKRNYRSNVEPQLVRNIGDTNYCVYRIVSNEGDIKQ